MAGKSIFNFCSTDGGSCGSKNDNQNSISKPFGTRNEFKDAGFINTPFSQLTEGRTITFNLISDCRDAHLPLRMGRKERQDRRTSICLSRHRLCSLEMINNP